MNYPPENASDEVLAACWNDLDFKEVERKLASMQRKYSLALLGTDQPYTDYCERLILKDLEFKCLAVKQVCAVNKLIPGVDGVIWKTPAEKMKAALAINAKGYKADPTRQVKITVAAPHLERYPRIYTLKDRAMAVWQSYVLLPKLELSADTYSFAFRKGRSQFDAIGYLLQTFRQPGHPEYALVVDIKSCYANIAHDWILSHLPMNRHILKEFLKTGFVYGGQLYDKDNAGISEGFSLSPYIANFVLDGLQAVIYETIHGVADPKGIPAGYCIGQMIRFCDDVVVAVRSEREAKSVLYAIELFLKPRGLKISKEKTRIVSISEGFTFLGKTFIERNGLFECIPSQASIDRFIDRLRQTVEKSALSERQLIEKLNRMLTGWATYYRFDEAREAYRQVDNAVQTMLLDRQAKKHPSLPVGFLCERFWYDAGNGNYIYALEHDKTVRVQKLKDIPPHDYIKVDLHKNPYINTTYFEEFEQNKKVQNISGDYRKIWNRQNGKCAYCGREILPDQKKAIVPLDLHKRPSILNSCYVHRFCKENSMEAIYSDDEGFYRIYDLLSVLEPLAREREEESALPVRRLKLDKYKYQPLEEFFHQSQRASITLTFSEIETIIGEPLPKSAYSRTDWWSSRTRYCNIADSYKNQGYSIYRISLTLQRITFHRDEAGLSILKIPDEILQGKIPDDAVMELENFFAYIIKKYGLTK